MNPLPVYGAIRQPDLSQNRERLGEELYNLSSTLNRLDTLILAIIHFLL